MHMMSPKRTLLQPKSEQDRFQIESKILFIAKTTFDAEPTENEVIRVIVPVHRYSTIQFAAVKNLPRKSIAE